jgi:hypothetical protein
MKAGQNITHNPDYIQRRFWTKVAVTQDTDTCWLWLRSYHPTGYGQFSFKLKPTYAHRLAYIFFHNTSLEDIAGWDILHNCDNRPCCNPYHLRQGTAKDNQADISLRGNPKYRKVSPEQVRYIRRAIQWRTLESLAREFHMTDGNVWLIVKRKSHRLVSD